MTRRGEFDLIAELFAPLSDQAQGLALTDDAALFSPTPGHRVVLTTDTVVEGVHYRSDDPAYDVGRKALRVNLSDLAAMGAAPRGYLLNLAVGDAVDDAWLEAFAAGLAEDNQIFAVVLLGGDTVRQPGPTAVSITAVGEVREGHALKRSGAEAGDLVIVSGTVGDGLAGLKAQQGAPPIDKAALDYLIGRYRLPQPRLDLGLRLRGLASAVLDVSDGLVADLGHICAASGVGAVVQAASVPVSSAVEAAIEASLLKRDDVLGGGDDYELLFCVRPETQPVIDRLAEALDLPLTTIGAIETDGPVRVLDPTGSELKHRRSGHTHF